jgi:tRNA (cmo5U34)-methyltransferase
MHDINPDTIYANPLAEVSRFAFDQRVVDVFPDMIKRSVPGYATIINMIGPGLLIRCSDARDAPPYSGSGL